MKYALVKYKDLKLLIDESASAQSLISCLPEIEELALKVNDFNRNLFTATKEQAQVLESEKRTLMEKVGYKIIGVPFTNSDAELYAFNEKLNFEEIVLHGNFGNQNAVKKEEKEFEQINIRVEKPLKTLAVRHVNHSNHKNLTQYIEYLIKKDLNLD